MLRILFLVLAVVSILCIPAASASWMMGWTTVNESVCIMLAGFGFGFAFLDCGLD